VQKFQCLWDLEATKRVLPVTQQMLFEALSLRGHAGNCRCTLCWMMRKLRSKCEEILNDAIKEVEEIWGGFITNVNANPMLIQLMKNAEPKALYVTSEVVDKTLQITVAEITFPIPGQPTTCLPITVETLSGEFSIETIISNDEMKSSSVDELAPLGPIHETRVRVTPIWSALPLPVASISSSIEDGVIPVEDNEVLRNFQEHLVTPPHPLPTLSSFPTMFAITSQLNRLTTGVPISFHLSSVGLTQHDDYFMVSIITTN